ncbi:hypothetical protein AYM17_00565 [Coxiella burnetii]|uniref:Uncharacterized protein n=2 Tax=Coxiella burnetii TaxID=777 RepID=Q83AY7_COXBU|nr:hypothetical protein CBU_1740 [Coxiella burnetii RSA 493]ACI23081.1 hypothetical protein CBUD_0260a [Coxiella burnetii Dugway 5J108-111]ACJ17572.1 hypothetical protein CbuG_0121 [Coxiella burnetii CbuG_Q212]ACJ19578.1 hypothetical protein CbuK_0267 [Coxiella burnetii CbuK_Q154]APQ66991.1 hypothetical protein A35_01325 [Coxiella burnetii 'MSU Goat Q177']ATN66041.1 hypothetical protein AYM17_00565 [Coxiella burnetii]
MLKCQARGAACCTHIITHNARRSRDFGREGFVSFNNTADGLAGGRRGVFEIKANK